MSLRKTALAAAYYRLIENRLIPLISRRHISANQYSLIGLLLAICVPFGFYLHPVSGLILIVLSGIADTLDGLTARHSGTASPLGAFVDSTVDRISDFFYLFGIWVLFWHKPAFSLSSALIFLGYLVTFMVSYIKARASALDVACDVGGMERGYRTVYLIVWIFFVCILPDFELVILWSGLIIYIAITSVTAFQRFFLTNSRLSR